MENRITIVHDYLIQMGGAERVVATMASAYPEAPIYTSATHQDELFPVFKDRLVRNSFVQLFPGLKKHFKKYFFVYPFAFQSLRLPKSDAVWISASTFAKFIRAPKGAKTFCYCHAPTRFLWDTDNYINDEVKNGFLNWLSRKLLPFLRNLDYNAANRMDYLIANSENVRKRILKHYGREADVIHPPVNVSGLKVAEKSGTYDIIVSRLIGYKRIDLAVEAYTRAGKELRIIGDGTDRQRLESMAGPTVSFLGRVSDDEMTKQLSEARAFVFPGEEDFGISPVEAQACGKPVIAYAAGGALETVVDGVTGVFFNEKTPSSLLGAVLASEDVAWDPRAIRKHAEKFSEEKFLEMMREYINSRI